MINNIFIWGSKSYALLIDRIIKNYSKNLNLKYLQSNTKNLKVKIIFDPYAKKQSYKLQGIFLNKISDFKKNVKKCKSFIVCIGDNFGKSCSSKIKNYFVNFFKQNNLNVTLNLPYAGGYITRNYGKKNYGFHAIQIEINKKLYLNENSYELNSNLEKLQMIFSKLFEELVNFQKAAAE